MASLPDSHGNKSEIFGLIPSNPDPLPAAGSKHYTLSRTSFGVSFGLSANRLDLLHESLGYLPLKCSHSTSLKPALGYSLLRYSQSLETEPVYRLRRNGRLLFTCTHRQEFLDRFHSIVTLDVAERSRQRTFVHAGVVGWGGYAILIPGRSFTGKTTLVTELIRAGASYYSDEYAVIDKRGRVHPYARPLQVREHGDYRQTLRGVEEFGAVAGSKPLPVKLVLVTRFKPHGRWQPRFLSPGIGLLRLLDNTVSARRSPAVALVNLKQAVEDAMIVRGVRGEASQLVEWIAAHFGPPKAGARTVR